MAENATIDFHISNEAALEVDHVTNKILVPIFSAIGILGNSLSITVLTRKRMRCSSNIYLAGLAAFDLLYIVMSLLLSFKKYKFIIQCKFYFQLLGVQHWLIDSFNYISMYITVAFTIERYIAICHPMKGQKWCTEARARKVIAIIAIIVTLSVLSTAFEYEKIEKDYYFNKETDRVCLRRPTEIEQENNSTDIVLEKSLFRNEDKTIHSRHHSAMNYSKIRGKMKSDPPNGNQDLENEIKTNLIKDEHKLQSIRATDNNGDCYLVKGYGYIGSAVQNHPKYKIFIYFSVIAYNIFPFIILVTFNFFLIKQVRDSERMRREMTNNVNSRQAKQKLSAITQQNKVTITLIAVVIMFIICQTPWAVLSILAETVDISRTTLSVLSNITNMLTELNSSSNFVLYCVLSDKYRKTVKELFMGYRYQRQGTMYDSNFSRQSTLASSWYNRSVRSNPSIRNHQPNNISSFKRPPPPPSSPSLTSKYVTSITNNNNNNNSSPYLGKRPTVPPPLPPTPTPPQGNKSLGNLPEVIEEEMAPQNIGDCEKVNSAAKSDN